MREYPEKVESIHFKRVRRRWVKNPEDWKGASGREYSGVSGEDQERFWGLRCDAVYGYICEGGDCGYALIDGELGGFWWPQTNPPQRK